VLDGLGGQTRRAACTAALRRTIRFSRVSLVAAIVCALSAVAGVVSAQADTVQSQLSYQAYNLFLGWKPPSVNKCTKPEPIFISQPAVPGTYPVLVYLHGTLADWGGNKEGQTIAQLAAKQGFLGAAFTYSDITPTQQSIDSQANCMFNVNSPGNAIAQVCALPQADCSHGFLVSGFSAGGAIALRAKNFNDAVDAAWVMGVDGPAVAAALAAPAGTRALPNDLLRMDIGQTDLNVTDTNTKQTTIDFSKLAAMTGQSCVTFNCLNADGSGYYVVQNSEVADGVADHCYWMRINKWVPTNSCTWNVTPTSLDPGFAPPSITAWSFTSSLDWLSAKLANSPAVPQSTVIGPAREAAGSLTAVGSAAVVGAAPMVARRAKVTSTRHRRSVWRRHRRVHDRWLRRVS
jgi:poly(3-hydroxybutyrate) depolymerase